MDNHNDTLFNQIKSAAHKAENQEFPGMEKVWSRVEDKLDNKVLTKQNTLWKKIAVAASILLVASIGYQFFMEEKAPEKPQNQIVTADTIKKTNDAVIQAEGAVAETGFSSPQIKENAADILKQQTAKQKGLALNDTVSPKILEETVVADKIATLQRHAADESTGTHGTWLVDRNFNSRGVTQVEMAKTAAPATASEKASKKEAPLYVVDGKKGNKEMAEELDANEMSSLVTLPDPLYIINGTQYTEKELFGPNPTSPYAPLDKQKIETISILQDEKAVSIYGEKGKKGVVIITTKDGKPAASKGR